MNFLCKFKMDLFCRLDGNSCRCTAAQTAHYAAHIMIELKVLAAVAVVQCSSAAVMSKHLGPLSGTV